MRTLSTLVTAASLLAGASGAPGPMQPPKEPSPGAAAETASPEAPARPVSPEGSGFSPEATRFLADGVDDYLAAMRSRLRINSTGRGPFGLLQVPTDEPSFVKPKRPKVRAATPFEDVIEAIPIAAVFASEQEFMVDATMYRQGQVVSLVADDQEINVRIERVRSSGISFRNLKSGEVIQKRLDLLPRGVMQGIGPDRVPGMIPTGGSRPPPLHVQLDTPPPTP